MSAEQPARDAHRTTVMWRSSTKISSIVADLLAVVSRSDVGLLADRDHLAARVGDVLGGGIADGGLTNPRFSAGIRQLTAARAPQVPLIGAASCMPLCAVAIAITDTFGASQKLLGRSASAAQTLLRHPW